MEPRQSHSSAPTAVGLPSGAPAARSRSGTSRTVGASRARSTPVTASPTASSTRRRRTRLFVPGQDGVIAVWDLDRPRPAGAPRAGIDHSVEQPELSRARAAGEGRWSCARRRFQPGQRRSDARPRRLNRGRGRAIRRLPGRDQPRRRARCAQWTEACERHHRGRGSSMSPSGDVVSAPIPSVALPGPVMALDDTADRLAISDAADQGRVHVVNWRTGLAIGDPIDADRHRLADFPRRRALVRAGLDERRARRRVGRRKALHPTDCPRHRLWQLAVHVRQPAHDQLTNGHVHRGLEPRRFEREGTLRAHACAAGVPSRVPTDAR